MTIHIIMGPPCAGKTTFLNQNARPGEPRVDYDAICKTLGSTLDHAKSEPIKQVSWAARAAAIARIFEGVDSDAWIIQHNATSEQIGRWKKQGCEFHIVDPGIDVCLQRAKEEKRGKEVEQAIESWYKNRSDISDEKVRGVRTKTINVKLKAAGDTTTGGSENGKFSGYCSVFNNIDSYGEIVAPGAFAETIKEDGPVFPCYWGHRMDDPLFNIGKTTAISEDDHGLLVEVELDVKNNERAAYVNRLINEGRVKQMSFAFDVVEYKQTNEAVILTEVKLHEVSVVPVGANQETEINPGKPDKPDKPDNDDNNGNADEGDNEQPEGKPEGDEEKPKGEAAKGAKLKPDAALADFYAHIFESI